MTWVAGAQYNYNFDRCLFMPATLTAGAEYNQDRLKDNMWGRGRYLDQRVNTVSALRRMSGNGPLEFSGRCPHGQAQPAGQAGIQSACQCAFQPTDNINLRASYSFGFRAPQASTKTCTLTTWAERYR